MELKIPKLSLVLLIGPSSCGKSTFARAHFLPTEVLSSDFCRALVCDDENNQKATKDAFELLNFIAAKRLAAGRLTVIDATNVQPESRKPLIALAREYHCIPTAIVFDIPLNILQERGQKRTDRVLPPHVIPQQRTQLQHSLPALKKEGFRYVFVLDSEEAVNTAIIERVPLWPDKSDLTGPFDIIGDVHGCCDELEELLEKLGYHITGHNKKGPMQGPVFSHPQGRIAIFLGDIVDRGPRIIDTIKLVYNMVKAGHALCVPGNHDMKLVRKLKGRNVRIAHGLEDTMAEIEALPGALSEPFQKEAMEFFDSLTSHYVLDKRQLVVAHAGLKKEMHGRSSRKVRDFCLYGDTTGETDEFGLPIRNIWAAHYRGQVMVVYGHTPVPKIEWLNKTVNIDTGCVFGGKLTALRYPEKEFVSVAARKVYKVSRRPLKTGDDHDSGLTTQQREDDLLDAEDVMGKRVIDTRLRPNVTIREEQAAAALEVISRYAANPKWLIYLPPTMSPAETSPLPGYLEHPAEAFSYYQSCGVHQVICQEKHMGSRAVVIACKDEAAVKKHFGLLNEGSGIIYTRTGRRFFTESERETGFLDRVRKGLDKAGYWETFKSDWVCLDCELMPWSEKAQELLKTQYAAVGVSAAVSLDAAVSALKATAGRTTLERDFAFPEGSSTVKMDIAAVQEKFAQRRETISEYITAYRRYCWTVNSIEDLKLAPFHLLATENNVYFNRDHQWHIETLSALSQADPGLFVPTPYKIIDTTMEESIRGGIRWWEELTAGGGEGMVVKPMDFIARGDRGLL